MTTATVTQGGPSGHPHSAWGESPVAAAELRAVWAMSAPERIAAMWDGELTLRQLCHWSSHAPEEVPLLAGEFAWIVMRTPDWAEPGEPIKAAV